MSIPPQSKFSTLVGSYGCIAPGGGDCERACERICISIITESPRGTCRHLFCTGDGDRLRDFSLISFFGTAVEAGTAGGCAGAALIGAGAD